MLYEADQTPTPLPIDELLLSEPYAVDSSGPSDRWEEEIAQHLEAVGQATEAPVRARHFLMAARIFEQQLGDAAKALILTQEAWAEDFSQAAVAVEVERLAERLDQWSEVVEAIDAKVQALPVGPAREVVLMRLSAWHELRLGDPAAAVARLEAALTDDLSLATGHVERALADLCLRNGDPSRAIEILLRGAGLAHVSTSIRLQWLREAAALAAERLQDAAVSARLHERILTIDPQDTAATVALAELAWASRDFATAGPRLVAAASLPAISASDRARFLQRAATAALALGQDDRARSLAADALATGAGTEDFFVEWNDVAFERGWWETTAELSDLLLRAKSSARLDSAQLATLRMRLARARLESGSPVEALSALEPAVEASPSDRGVLELAVQCARNVGDPRTLFRHLRGLLAATPKGGNRFELLVEIGHLCRDKLEDPDKALAALGQAQQERPEDRGVLHDLLDLHTSAKNWKDAVAALQALAESETGPSRAKYLVAAANILHYELHASDEAVELYERVLDDDPTDLKTFERLDKIFTSKRAWRDEARSYRRMIKRLGAPATPELRAITLMMWRGLGEIYRTRMGDLPAAVAAFEVAAQLSGADETVDQEILAEIFEAGGAETWVRAVDLRSQLLERAQTVPEVVRQLRSLKALFNEAKLYDRLFGVCAALHALGQADAREQELYLRLASLPLPMPRGSLTEELWQKVIYHPSQDKRLSAVLAALAPALIQARAEEPKKLGLKDRAQLDLDRDPSTLSRLVSVGAAMLSVGRPAAVLLPDARGEIDVAPVRLETNIVTTFVVGGDLLRRQTERELAFVVGRALALLRSEHLGLSPFVIPSRAEMRLFVLAAIKLFQPAATFPEEVDPGFANYVTLLRRTLPPQNLDPLGQGIGALLAGGGAIDLEGWRNGAERTAARAGLLLAGDVNVAVTVIRTARPDDAGRDVALDLIKWSVSPAYLTLRDQLGLAVPPELFAAPAPVPQIHHR